MYVDVLLYFSDEAMQRVVRISPNGKLMATGGTDGKVRLWSFPKMELLRTIDAHTKEVIVKLIIINRNKLHSSKVMHRNIVMSPIRITESKSLFMIYLKSV